MLRQRRPVSGQETKTPELTSQVLDRDTAFQDVVLDEEAEGLLLQRPQQPQPQQQQDPRDEFVNALDNVAQRQRSMSRFRAWWRQSLSFPRWLFFLTVAIVLICCVVGIVLCSIMLGKKTPNIYVPPLTRVGDYSLYDESCTTCSTVYGMTGPRALKEQSRILGGTVPEDLVVKHVMVQLLDVDRQPIVGAGLSPPWSSIPIATTDQEGVATLPLRLASNLVHAPISIHLPLATPMCKRVKINVGRFDATTAPEQVIVNLFQGTSARWSALYRAPGDVQATVNLKYSFVSSATPVTSYLMEAWTHVDVAAFASAQGLTETAVMNEVAAAFQQWENAWPLAMPSGHALTFSAIGTDGVEAATGVPEAGLATVEEDITADNIGDIRIVFVDDARAPDQPVFTGVSPMMRTTSVPGSTWTPAGQIFINARKAFRSAPSLSATDNKYRLQAAVAHAIGEVLGLGRHASERDIMAQPVVPQQEAEGSVMASKGSLLALQQLYTLSETEDWEAAMGSCIDLSPKPIEEIF